jgi:hypothetical protein
MLKFTSVSNWPFLDLLNYLWVDKPYVCWYYFCEKVLKNSALCKRGEDVHHYNADE